MKRRLTIGLLKLRGKVILRLRSVTLTVSDNTNGVQSSPNFAKPLERYTQCGDSVVVNEVVSLKINNNYKIFMV